MFMNGAVRQTSDYEKEHLAYRQGLNHSNKHLQVWWFISCIAHEFITELFLPDAMCTCSANLCLLLFRSKYGLVLVPCLGPFVPK